ncbi:mutator protein MutT [Nocardia goodfellowii]|uniref:Mutator protein MutT n=2 Tax=Nocardia goodfellowii TaxID=882446 RepID=A0ABS4QKJ6_9NOCA|nr:mutator protein MutT [Nocardia goodfellowii]
MVFDASGKVFLARRGPAASNEVGNWEFPGGKVTFGERIEDAIRREFREEYGMEIELRSLIGLFDHILLAENQHWIAATYLAHHRGGTPRIREPEKCSEIGWYELAALPTPLSQISQSNLDKYLRAETRVEQGRRVDSR